MRVLKTRVGRGRPDSIRFLVDFALASRGPNLPRVAASQAPNPIATVRANHGIAGVPHVQRNPYTGGVRVGFEFDPAGANRSDLRLDLKSADGLPSESWRYRWLR